MVDRFNIRVYGLWLHTGNVLVSTERVNGMQIIKFPGGGLELGEGLHDCLHREWREEMGTSIEITRHFYTTDFFQKSLYDESQVISVYYYVQSPELSGFPLMNGRETFSWMPVDSQLEHKLTLPIDKLVARKLFEETANHI